jgi:hypothetical protein
MREHPKRQTKKEYLRIYQRRYYKKLRANGMKVFTIVTPASTIMTLKAFNRQLVLAFQKAQAETQSNVEPQTTQG